MSEEIRIYYVAKLLLEGAQTWWVIIITRKAREELGWVDFWKDNVKEFTKLLGQSERAWKLAKEELGKMKEN